MLTRFVAQQDAGRSPLVVFLQARATIRARGHVPPRSTIEPQPAAGGRRFSAVPSPEKKRRAQKKEQDQRAVIQGAGPEGRRRCPQGGRVSMGPVWGEAAGSLQDAHVVMGGRCCALWGALPPPASAGTCSPELYWP